VPERGLAFFADSPVAWQMFELLLKLKSAMPPPIDGTNPPAQYHPRKTAEKPNCECGNGRRASDFA
jgi:hypothetical protein